MPGCKKSILLVEDEAIICMATAKMLEQDYKVTTALSGQEAVAVIRSGKKIDLILMDIDLGKGMDGTTDRGDHSAGAPRSGGVSLVSYGKSGHRQNREDQSYGYVLKDTRYTVMFASIRMAFRLYEAHRELREKENKGSMPAAKAPAGGGSAGKRPG